MLWGSFEGWGWRAKWMQQNIGVSKTPGTQGESDFQQDPQHKAKDTHERLQNNNIYVV